jgi:peptidoglycan hydrolase CwlO-like protein
MKKTIFAALLAIVALSSCKDEFSNQEAIKRMQDTLFKVYPTMAGVSVHVEGWNELTVVARSSQLYNTSGENKQKVTAEISSIAQTVFGTNNELDTGQVIFTKDERSTDMAPADGQSYPISFKP